MRFGTSKFEDMLFFTACCTLNKTLAFCKIQIYYEDGYKNTVFYVDKFLNGLGRYYMNALNKKERTADIMASLSSLVLLLFAQLRDRFEFLHELPFLVVLLICIICMIVSIWAAYCRISNNNMIKMSLFSVSVTSWLATFIIFFSFR